MTLLYPSIDLRGGRVVRLAQGDYAAETVYGDDPVAVATGFCEEGAVWIHVVDLDAARTGEPVNRPAVAAVRSVEPGSVSASDFAFPFDTWTDKLLRFAAPALGLALALRDLVLPRRS